jgi:glycosyltransferase involved in cell wall biosynthesis
MQLYVIDDGSDDGFTPQIISDLEKSDKNITTFFFQSGPSGSASRPRNKGNDLAREPYIAFMDHDDEAINDGYSRLIEVLENQQDAYFAAGFSESTTHAPGDCLDNPATGVIVDTVEYLKTNGFKIPRLFSMVFRKECIDALQVQFIDGAYGQDNLFIHELFIKLCGKGIITDTPIIRYHNERIDSATNVINPPHFKKYQLTEFARARMLEQYGLMQHYLDFGVERRFKDDYITKLHKVAPSDLKASLEAVLEMIGYYYD